MRFPLACLAWPLGPRAAATYDSGIDGRGVDGREKGPMQATSGPSARQNSPCRPARLDQPVQNSPCRPARLDQPVQNSPGTPQNADFGPLFARRENFLPLSPPTTRAGRTLSRMQSRFRYKTVPARGLGGRYRYETLPARPARRPTRYKILPARPKTLISAHFSPAGRTLYRFRHQHDEQGEKSHAPTPHLSQPTPHLSPATCRSPNFACNSIA